MRLPEITYAPEDLGGVGGSTTPAPAAPSTPAPSPETINSQELTPSDAGRLLRSLRKTQAAEAAAAPQEGGEDGAPPYEIPSQEDGPAPDEDPASVETEDDAPQDAASEPPKSWSKEAREVWASLDPETQAYIAQRDREDNTAVRKAQSEAAQLRQYAQQAVETERMQLDQVRAQYEAALPDLYRMLSQNEAFADIQSFDDVERLAKEDWARYVEYDAYTKKVGLVQSQMLAAQQRQAEEYQHNWMRWSTVQDQKFAERVPDMRVPEKAKAVHEAGAKTLTDVGFSPHEINELWHGRASLSMRDARVQELFHDAIKFRSSKGKMEAARAQPLPAVQRPGATSSGNRNVQALTAAKQKLSQSGSIDDALVVLRAQRAANARRAR